jgi:1-acyl-sn-glycerol-3-phosphate acyltransferase
MLKVASLHHHRTLRADTPLAGDDRGAMTRWAGEMLRYLILFPALRLVAPLRVEGQEHLCGDGPFLFAANHSSHLDAPVVLAALPGRLRRRLRVAAAADYFFSTRWKGALVRAALNAFAFERKGPGREASLGYAQHLLDAGQSVLIFPEGTRSPDGQIQHFKRGVGTLALTTSVQVIPILLEGTHAAWPKRARWPRRQQVVVRFGAPLTFAAPSDPPGVAAQVEQAVRTLAQR